MSVLVTGGLGYIGSHTVVALQDKGYEVVVIDNLSNSNKNRIEEIEKISGVKLKFYLLDLKDYESLEKVFKVHNFESILHFAAFKSVSESIESPLKYYKNNIVTMLNLLKLSEKYKVVKFVFSSSATVYGNKNRASKESDEVDEIKNPYAGTKVMGEQILKDFVTSTGEIKATSLRYFNPIGAHESGLIGEPSSNHPSNLMPFIVKVASQELNRIAIFGDDYPTRDGTGIRDYIHVMDLAEGHVAALEAMYKSYDVYNLGTGEGTTVKELIETFEKTNDVKLPIEVTSRRAGDIAVSYADVRKVERELGWATSRTIEDMCRDSWKYKINESSNTSQTMGR